MFLKDHMAGKIKTRQPALRADLVTNHVALILYPWDDGLKCFANLQSAAELST